MGNPEKDIDSSDDDEPLSVSLRRPGTFKETGLLKSNKPTGAISNKMPKRTAGADVTSRKVTPFTAFFVRYRLIHNSRKNLYPLLTRLRPSPLQTGHNPDPQNLRQITRQASLRRTFQASPSTHKQVHLLPSANPLIRRLAATVVALRELNYFLPPLS